MTQLHIVDRLQDLEEETQDTNSHMKSTIQIKLSNQFSLPQRDACKTRKDTQYIIDKMNFE